MGIRFIILLGCWLCLLFACKHSRKPAEKDVVKTPKQLKERTSENLQELLTYAAKNNASMNDSVKLVELNLLKTVYEKNAFQTLWSMEGRWQQISDSLFSFISRSKEYGLFPSDYHYSSLITIRKTILADSASRRDAALWTRADLLFTDAYLKIAKDLKLGRIKPDSISYKKDSLINDAYFIRYFNQAVNNKGIISSFRDLEPKYPGYVNIKDGLPAFLNTAHFKKYTYLVYPFKDSINFIKSVRQRLEEDGYVSKDSLQGDSATLAMAVTKYQESKNIKATGKISEPLVRSLNNTDWEKFKSIAVTLDNYKLMPDSVPLNYVIVNLPAYNLYVYDSDTLALESKVIVGSPKTKTPLLNSRISNFITYPQWTVPYSIIFRDMLPRIQKNVSYLEKQNLMVVDRNDVVLNPKTIDWSKLSKDKFPYLIRQKEGDDNSLGVIKFNFVNKYSVYLHDTNTRWMFGKSARALSHGCVRVQRWKDLSRYLTSPDTLRFPPDSITAWISRQEKHMVTGFPRVPLFIRYFTVEGKQGELKFYTDIYGYDRFQKEQYFRNKPLG